MSYSPLAMADNAYGDGGDALPGRNARYETSMYRSEEMTYLQVVISREAAYETIKALGTMSEVGHPGVEFTDLNSDKTQFQRHYAPYIKRCVEVERIIRMLKGMVERHDITSAVVRDASEEGRGLFDGGMQGREPIESELFSLEGELVTMEKNLDIVMLQQGRLLERMAVLQSLGPVLGGGSMQRDRARSMDQGLMGRRDVEMRAPSESMLRNVSGTIPKESMGMFERLIYRAGRGNVHMRVLPCNVDRNVTEGGVEKVVFCALFQGDENQRKVEKIAKTFGANVFSYDANSVDADIRQVEADLGDRTRTMRMTRDHIQSRLGDLASKIPMWDEKNKRERAIYQTLNRFKRLADLRDDDGDGYAAGNSEFLTGEAWCPSVSVAAVEETLKIGQHMAHATAPSYCRSLRARTSPPTFFKTGPISKQFQSIVDAYGIARYRENSPVPYVMVFFPFFFAVMFGDIGHGFFVLIFACYLIWNQEKLKVTGVHEMVQTAFDGRHVVLMMGIFSILCGSLYNEVFGIPLTSLYIPSKWDYHGNNGTGGTKVYTGTDTCGLAEDKAGCNLPPMSPYWWGVDPAWKWAANGLQYTNSLKMKMSVVLGVSQMLFGITLKASNDIFFKEPLDFWCEFVPQIIFMSGIFGYMCLMVFMKWDICWLPDSDSEGDPDKGIPGWHMWPSTGENTPNDGKITFNLEAGGTMDYECTGKVQDSDGPPDIKQILISMFMNFGQESPNFTLYSGMNFTQQPMVLICLICPFIMLFPKPLILRKQNLERGDYGMIVGDDDEHDDTHGGGGGHGDGPFDFSEVFIHQVIETIEFVLGSISNTASYLRLWALSLAHAQLTDVFWEKVMVAGFEIVVDMGEDGGLMAGLVLVVCFAIWISVSFGVLLVMESLSATLHALRLTWVEFQNKFYHGDGAKFIPFDLNDMEVDEE